MTEEKQDLEIEDILTKIQEVTIASNMPAMELEFDANNQYS